VCAFFFFGLAGLCGPGLSCPHGRTLKLAETGLFSLLSLSKNERMKEAALFSYFFLTDLINNQIKEPTKKKS
jgi:hypothetical protein